MAPCEVSDDSQLRRALPRVVELLETFHVKVQEQVQERVAAERERRRTESSAGLESPRGWR